jgi:hypothetical protein
MRGLLLSLLAIFVFANGAQALLVTYTDQANFLIAAGDTTVYDFESDLLGTTAPTRDFGDFIIDATGGDIYSAEVRQLTTGGNKDVYVNTSGNAASLDVIFDTDISAFGFDWIAEGNNTYDGSIFSLLENTWSLGYPGSSGFFGVIETDGVFAAGTAFSFGQSTRNWSGVSFDNLLYNY